MAHGLGQVFNNIRAAVDSTEGAANRTRITLLDRNGPALTAAAHRASKAPCKTNVHGRQFINFFPSKPMNHLKL
jgi:hypothetical protein